MRLPPDTTRPWITDTTRKPRRDTLLGDTLRRPRRDTLPKPPRDTLRKPPRDTLPPRDTIRRDTLFGAEWRPPRN